MIEPWVDPLKVHLSNWSPEKSREILQNQPLVLVENLNVNSINMASLTDFGQAKKKLLKNVEIGIDHLRIAATELPCNTEIVLATELPYNNEAIFPTELPPSIEESKQVTNSQKDNELPKIEKVESLPIQNEVIQEDQNPLRKNDVVYIPPGNEELLESHDVKQQPDTTANIDHYFDEDGPIEISSESDVDELSMNHCYFCERAFRTLNGLGIHIQTCSMRPVP